LIVGEHAEVFVGDWTRAERDYGTDCVWVGARVSKTKDHSPGVSDHNKLFGVQLLAERFDVFHVCDQIDRGRVVTRQLRSAGATLFPYDASILFAELVSDTLHRADVFTGSAT
jgi:hypothetical protein